MTAGSSAAPPVMTGPSAMQRRWLRTGSMAAFVAAVGALIAAVAGGITEPTGLATGAAVVASVIAYGIAPLVITFAMRQSARSSWWAVAAAFLAAAFWSFVAAIFVSPAIIATAPTLIEALVNSAPSASALWILVASVETIRAGMQRWSLLVVAAFLSVLIVGSILIEFSGFDIRKVLVPLGWAVWMVDLARTLRTRMSPHVERTRAIVHEPACANCGSPRRTDGLAFCSACGLPYGTRRT